MHVGPKPDLSCNLAELGHSEWAGLPSSWYAPRFSWTGLDDQDQKVMDFARING